ncbi:MAG: 5-formyltetrahydrofolate cyclo-ligase [Verrucomicrobia bacterium]|nr:5-formyltetrahydrofolate cyclo-ligase [Verrucomicrobiota bacterium]
MQHDSSLGSSAAAAKRTKGAIRSQLRAKLNSLSLVQRFSVSALACDRLRADEIWSRSDSILGYFPLADELDVRPLLATALAAGKTVALPRFNTETSAYEAAHVRDLDRDLHPGRFGIREPSAACPVVALNRLDLVMVPGVGFDLSGHRLGRGKGFYDRMLVQVSGCKCGVAFDEQVVAALPVEPHDIVLDCIVTPTRWLTFGPRAVLK